MELGTWVDHAESQVVQTSWAALALMSARYPDSEPIEKAVKFVMSKQASVRKLYVEVNF
jgi:lanosterol synthase